MRATPVLISRVFAFLLGSFLASSPVHAEDSNTLFDVYSVSAAAARSVDNDRVNATLTVLAEGRDSAALADQVNQRMRAALDALQAYPGIETETRGYRSEPRYDSSSTGGRRLSAWRVVQTLALTSMDPEAVSEALGVLQKDLQLQSLHFDVSPETRSKVADELIGEALAAFQARADIIARSMGRSGYRVVNVDVSTDEAVNNPRGGVMMMEARSKGSAPALEGGDTRVSVRVFARIQLSDGGEE